MAQCHTADSGQNQVSDPGGWSSLLPSKALAREGSGTPCIPPALRMAQASGFAATKRSQKACYVHTWKLQARPQMFDGSFAWWVRLKRKLKWVIFLLVTFLFVCIVLRIFNTRSTLFGGFPGGSDGKESACSAGDLGSIPGSGRFPWRRAWQHTPVFLPGEFHGLEEPGGLQSMGSQSFTSIISSNTTFLPGIRKWQPTILAWAIPWTKEPGGLQSMVSQRAGHDLATMPPPPLPS